MTILSRSEQERLILSFEQDYGKLVMACNQTYQVEEEAKSLLGQIECLERTVQLEDDLLDFLSELSASIAIYAEVPAFLKLAA